MCGVCCLLKIDFNYTVWSELFLGTNRTADAMMNKLDIPSSPPSSKRNLNFLPTISGELRQYGIKDIVKSTITARPSELKSVFFFAWSPKFVLQIPRMIAITDRHV